eukprot:352277-Chlamydomonas_euryale.AAC.4
MAAPLWSRSEQTAYAHMPASWLRYLDAPTRASCGWGGLSSSPLNPPPIEPHASDGVFSECRVPASSVTG